MTYHTVSVQRIPRTDNVKREWDSNDFGYLVHSSSMEVRKCNLYRGTGPWGNQILRPAKAEQSLHKTSSRRKLRSPYRDMCERATCGERRAMVRRGLPVERKHLSSTGQPTSHPSIVGSDVYSPTSSLH